MEAASYVQRKKQDDAKTLAEAALFSQENLTADEEQNLPISGLLALKAQITQWQTTLRQWAEVDFVPEEKSEHKDSKPLRCLRLRLRQPQGSPLCRGSCGVGAHRE